MYVFALAGSYIGQIALHLVWLIGIAISLILWRRHPRASLLTLIALVVLMLDSLAARFLVAPFIEGYARRAAAGISTGLLVNLIGGVRAVIAAGAWALILLAIFGWRDGRSTQ